MTENNIRHGISRQWKTKRGMGEENARENKKAIVDDLPPWNREGEVLLFHLRVHTTGPGRQIAKVHDHDMTCTGTGKPGRVVT